MFRRALGPANAGANQSSRSSGISSARLPAESTADASQLGDVPTVRVNLGCFNVGLGQDMIPKDKHQTSLGRVIAKGFMEQDLHILTLCEVGGHKKGLEKTFVQAQTIVSTALTQHYKATSWQAYMATWQAARELSDENSVWLSLRDKPEDHELSHTTNPQLVIMAFTIDAAQHPDKQGLLMSGQLHIRQPNQGSTSLATKKKTGHEGSAGHLGAQSVDCEQWRFLAYCASPCAHRRREPGQDDKRHHRAKASR